MENLILLKTPIVKKSFFKNESLNKITIRKIKPKDMFGLSKEPDKWAESNVILISRLTGLPKKVIENMDMQDFNKLNIAVSEQISKACGTTIG